MVNSKTVFDGSSSGHTRHDHDRFHTWTVKKFSMVSALVRDARASQFSAKLFRTNAFSDGRLRAPLTSLPVSYLDKSTYGG